MKNTFNWKVLIIFLFCFVTLSAGQVRAEEVKHLEGFSRSNEKIVVKYDEVVDSDIICTNGDVEIEGKVNGNLIVINGKVNVRGVVTKDILVVDGSISKTPQGQVLGTQYRIKNKLGDIISASTGAITFMVNNQKYIETFLVVFCLILGIILYVAYNVKIQEIVFDYKSKPMKTMIIGYSALVIVVPLIVLISVITIVGMVAIPLLLVFLIVVSILGFISLGKLFGDMIIRNKCSKMLEAVKIIVGLFIMCLIAIIPKMGMVLFLFLFLPAAVGGVLGQLKLVKNL